MSVSTATLQQSEEERRLKFDDLGEPALARINIHVPDPLIMQQDRESYLSNEHQQVVTPFLNDDNAYPADVVNLTEVPDPRIPAHALTDKQKTEKHAFTAYMKAHNIGPTSREASREVLRAMTKRKQTIGPGIDRGGCTLINEEMRGIFVQNPGIRRVVALDE